ncbi:MAG: cobalamin B12-binding domain-containing protein [Planctomycetota bacterium]
MAKEQVLERYLNALIEGNRKQCRAVIEETLQSGIPANSVCMDVIWPIMVEIEQLFRSDRITAVQEHLAARINRTIVDQLQNKLPHRPSRGKRVVICCAQSELQELGAQIMADLFESDGWEVRFLGGGLTDDDILAFVNEYAPDILMIYGTVPKRAPEVRRLIDRLKSVNAWPDMRIMLSGGVFNRAEGLWQEIGGDLFAESPGRALCAASENRPMEPEAAGGSRRRRKRHKAASDPAVHVA